MDISLEAIAVEQSIAEQLNCCGSCGRPSKSYGDMWETKNNGQTSWLCRVDEAGCRAVAALRYRENKDAAAAERLALTGPLPLTDEEFFARFGIRVADLVISDVQYRDGNTRFQHPPSGRMFKRSCFGARTWSESVTTTTGRR